MLTISASKVVSSRCANSACTLILIEQPRCSYSYGLLEFLIAVGV